jgi:hypothetical protein
MLNLHYHHIFLVLAEKIPILKHYYYPMKQNYYLQNTNNEEHIMSKLSTNSSVSQSNQIHYKSMSQLTEIEQENIPVPISSSPIYENNNLSIVQTIQKNQLIKEVKK